MKKHLIHILIILFLSTSFTTFAVFTDVDENLYPFHISITWLEEQGVVEGYSDGTFRPHNNVNRAEFLKMLYETIGLEGYDPRTFAVFFR
jgi:hypothetical protein